MKVEKLQNKNILNKYICKLNGIKDHGKNFINLDFIDIKNDSMINIQKYDEYDNQMITHNWIFEVERVYNVTDQYEEIYENEIESSDFILYTNNVLRGTLIFIGKNSDSFFDNSNYPYMFVFKSLRDLINNCNSASDCKKLELSHITISFIEINENKFIDYLKFEGNNNNTYTKIKINECTDEIFLEGRKEISINSLQQFEYLMNLASQKNKFINKKENKSNQFSHQLITIKIYKQDFHSYKTKFNFLLYKAYEINGKLSKLNEHYTINTKENFNFFESLNNNKLRNCKILRIIKDTLISNNNITLISLPISLNYIILMHDILNYVKMRKSKTISNSFNKILLNDNLSDKLRSKSEDKENFTPNTKINLEIEKNLSSVSIDIEKNSILNISRLKKIKEKENIRMFLNYFNNN